ncbi:hypothetical protein OJAV_G00060710 [Oryzias javanicus]|uniref:Uncharacterized protein n=1 Tax=Oryzias javanicus TaxID=123683 RepID=A0A437DBX6_ORYJA|nr:hypothetical protein OJAV_G00060710 [Oryzias javanicus]
MSSCQRRKSGKRRARAASEQARALRVKNTQLALNRIKAELWWAKKERRINRRAVLQVFKRRRSSQNHLEGFSGAFKAMRSAQEHTELINRMNELIKDSLQTEDAAPDGSDGLYSPSVLLAELEKLEQSLEEEEVLAASPSHHARLEEEEDIEEDLEYLRQWANSL